MKHSSTRHKTSNLSTNASVNKQTIDFSKININKIEEYIELMEEHQLDCEKTGNFIEAELARQRVIQLRKIKEKKDFKNAKVRQQKETQELINKQKEEIKEFNNKMDYQYAELMSKFDAMKKELEEKHEHELQEFIESFENNYPSEPKISNDLANAKKQLEYYVKQKDYPNAHLTQVEIEEISRRDLENFENEKEKKIEKEITALRLKHKNELDALELKISVHVNKFQRERSIKAEEIELKYKHKKRGLENSQNAEREEFQRIINNHNNNQKNNLNSTRTKFGVSTRSKARSMPKKY